MDKKGIKGLIPISVMDEPMPNLPLVEIAGNRRVLVENHRGVTEYGCNCIRIKVNDGTVCVDGSCLELCQMTREQLIICGQIESVRLLWEARI